MGSIAVDGEQLVPGKSQGTRQAHGLKNQMIIPKAIIPKVIVLKVVIPKMIILKVVGGYQ